MAIGIERCGEIVCRNFRRHGRGIGRPAVCAPGKWRHRELMAEAGGLSTGDFVLAGGVACIASSKISNLLENHQSWRRAERFVIGGGERQAVFGAMRGRPEIESRTIGSALEHLSIAAHRSKTLRLASRKRAVGDGAHRAPAENAVLAAPYSVIGA